MVSPAPLVGLVTESIGTPDLVGTVSVWTFVLGLPGAVVALIRRLAVSGPESGSLPELRSARIASVSLRIAESERISLASGLRSRAMRTVMS